MVLNETLNMERRFMYLIWINRFVTHVKFMDILELSLLSCLIFTEPQEKIHNQ